MRTLRLAGLYTGVLIIALAVSGQAGHDPLPSWNVGGPKGDIIEFVQDVTDPATEVFVPPSERIAVFDNDGTLWVEHPMYTQLAFALDRIKALAPLHPQWKSTEPFKSALAGDMTALAALGEKGIAEIIAATHAGMSTAEFAAIVRDWIAQARHPRFNRSYTALVYQPMLELLRYLRSNGFKTFIVSGGGIEFMRPWSEAVYCIPPEQVVGSSVHTKYEMQDGKPVLMRLPQVDFIDDKAGKPVGINAHIGKRPVMAFGNSLGDREMLEWTNAGAGARMVAIILHDDPEREDAYGPATGLPDTKFGAFPQSLFDQAMKQGWLVISMKRDWRTIFPDEKAQTADQRERAEAAQ